MSQAIHGPFGAVPDAWIQPSPVPVNVIFRAWARRHRARRFAASALKYVSMTPGETGTVRRGRPGRADYVVAIATAAARPGQV